MSQNFAEIAKEITIAAVQSGIIVPPGKGQYKSFQELREYNQRRANEVAYLYKTIAKAVNEVYNGNFDFENKQE